MDLTQSASTRGPGGYEGASWGKVGPGVGLAALSSLRDTLRRLPLIPAVATLYSVAGVELALQDLLLLAGHLLRGVVAESLVRQLHASAQFDAFYSQRPYVLKAPRIPPAIASYTPCSLWCVVRFG